MIALVNRYRAWRHHTLATTVVVLGLLALLPLTMNPLDSKLDFMIFAVGYVMMALGLNIVVGFAGLLDLGYVAFYAVGAYTVGWFASDFFSAVNGGEGIHVGVNEFTEQPARHPPELHTARGCRDDPVRDRGRPDRFADAAPARRLHRDRDARVRRDHPHDRRERRQDHDPDRQPQADQRAHGDLARRPAEAPVPRPVRLGVQLAPLFLARARHARDRAVHQLPAARLAPRARLDRRPRGRGGRGLDGRPARAGEAARLRCRRGDRRSGGRVSRLLQQRDQLEPVPVLLLDLRSCR